MTHVASVQPETVGELSFFGERAIIWDADGTFLDTSSYIPDAYVKAFSTIEHAIQPKDVHPHIGKELRLSYNELHGEHASDEGFAAFFNSLRRIQSHPDRIASVTAYPGIVDVLEYGHTMGAKQAVCSSRHTNLVPTMDAAGVTHFFDAIVQGNETIRPKPKPDPAIEALRRLDVAASNAIMIGDSHVDMLSARDAGVAVRIGVSWGFGKPAEMIAGGAQHIVHGPPALGRLLRTLLEPKS